MNGYGTLLDATLPITNPRRTGVGSKPALDSDKVVSNYLNNGIMLQTRHAKCLLSQSVKGRNQANVTEFSVEVRYLRTNRQQTRLLPYRTSY